MNSPPDNRRPFVLIVEGHDDTRDLYVEGLAQLGFETMGVDDGARAYERARESLPDAIITELALHHHDGWDLLHHVKGDPRTRDIPVVIVTSYVDPARRDRAERDGCAALFLKPFLPEELATALRRVLDRPTGP